mmetsp:Transcript_32910/g.40698  ORF Transcript_32910/g.40698 Transcript_32910/m.40698 type:complete len:147 (+) Transcript_32910:286-726(+)|eukprot:CAMPEP_0170464874 /NCGR_PEP_ID=MMETSP0123-20130129/9423_1 /TAXON_ID=182087 /ORGANISM="Favella ehrenbergii, Strain Fehren 1" /LENGTH=146 /DNA_ID=CAMNT_0010730617 /DNA_START=213 /DNA_END=653 /DNA_ORIENTATION=-
MLHFSTKESIAISSAIVAESALLRFVFFSAYGKHPDRDGATEIDYNLSRAVFPTFLIGSYFGVILSVSLGELVLAILIMAVLTALSFQTLFKAIALFKKESAKLRADEAGNFIRAEAGTINAAYNKAIQEANESTQAVEQPEDETS